MLVHKLNPAFSINPCHLSITNRYIKNAHRSRLRDELASATLHLQQLRTLVNVENLQPSNSLVLDFQRALKHVQNSLQDLQKKYVDTRISRVFDENGHERAYAGTINDVNWSRDNGCYLFHVSYDSDSDEEDLELWEVQKYQTCDI